MVKQMPSKEAFGVLKDDAAARLIDVRTQAEWTFVGVPDLAAIGKQAAFLPWQTFPTMAVDPDFAAKLASALKADGANETTPLLFMCRSGGRSQAAAEAMAAAGFSACINVSDGFEGQIDGEGHRGTVSGWKASGLPWRQS